MKRPTIFALTLAVALGAAGALWSGSPAVAQSKPASSAFDAATFNPKSLFLCNADAVIQQLGVPTEINANDHAMLFRYGGEGGLSLAIEGDKGLCVAAEGKLPRGFKRTPPPALGGVYSGQSSREFLKRKGMPKGFTLNNVALVLEYADLGGVVLSHGRAVFASKPN